MILFPPKNIDRIREYEFELMRYEGEMESIKSRIQTIKSKMKDLQAIKIEVNKNFIFDLIKSNNHTGIEIDFDIDVNTIKPMIIENGKYTFHIQLV